MNIITAEKLRTERNGDWINENVNNNKFDDVNPDEGGLGDYFEDYCAFLPNRLQLFVEICKKLF